MEQNYRDRLQLLIKTIDIVINAIPFMFKRLMRPRVEDLMEMLHLV